MGDNSAIEWTDATWQPILGCSLVSPGCTNCYAMRLAGTRLRNHPSRQGLTVDSKAGPVWNGQVRLYEPALDQPLRWRRPRRIFVCAHGDLFHEAVPDEWIDRVFAVMALAPQHTFQVLTKRAGRMRKYLTNRPGHLKTPRIAVIAEASNIAGLAAAEQAEQRGWPLPNVQLGVSAEDQRRADERLPDLLLTPAAKHFVSAEPLLGPIDLTKRVWADCYIEEYGGAGSELIPLIRRLDWVIVGGESGPGARPMHPDWVRSLRDQCASARVPFFFKQWGDWLPGEVYAQGDYGGFVRHQDGTNNHHRGKQDDWWSGDTFGGIISTKVGKKSAGATLDGREWREMPV